MTRRQLAALAAVAGVALGAMLAGPLTRHADRTATEAVVRDYLLAHPELIPQAMARLQDQQAGQAIRAERAALTTPFAGAWAGNPAGDVTLVMFSDYACGYCRASLPAIDRLLHDDPKLRVVWREIPVLGPDSEAAARLALAAAQQGRYPALHHQLFAGRPDAERRTAAVRATGLDPARLAAAGATPAVSAELGRNLALATRLGVDGTPAFVVGDQMLSGAVGYDRLAAAIKAARATG